MTAVRFALNRTCAPQLPLDDFLALARASGAEAVELRNDVPGREFMDGTPAAVLRERVAGAGLRLASVNALQRFNDWTPRREAEARALASYAAALGAPGIVLCPVVEGAEDWSEADRARRLREGLRGLRPILADHGVLGFIEPLGMKGSTLKRQVEAVEAVEDLGGWEGFALCHDTFQFYRCGDDRAFPEHVGLVHVSGISRRDLLPGDLTEPDRELVFVDDRAGTVAQLEALLVAGYRGHVSMEPFSPATQSDPQLAAHLRASLEFLQLAVRIEEVAA